jgi:hypothetical protein
VTVYRCIASGVFAGGSTWSFRQHFDSSAVIATIQGDWFAQINSFWTNGTHGVETLYPTGTVLTLTQTSALSGVPFREGAQQSGTATLAGTSADDGLPEQTCILVSLRGAEAGKKNRGRIHLPAPVETAAVGSELTSVLGTRVSAAIGALYDGMRLAGHNPVIYNTKISKVPTVDPVAQTLKTIVTEEVDRVLRTQRKRTKSKVHVYV